jgi:hypothetical protein
LKRAYDLFRSEDNRPRANPRPARDRPKSQTFAICAKMALPLQLPLNSKRPVRVEMYWNGRKRKGVRPFLASTFMGSLKLRQNVEGSNSKSDGKKRKTIPLGFWLVCADRLTFHDVGDAGNKLVSCRGTGFRGYLRFLRAQAISFSCPSEG